MGTNLTGRTTTAPTQHRPDSQDLATAGVHKGSLRLLTRFEVVLARRHDRRLPDALPAAEGRQCGIRHRRAGCRQFYLPVK